MSSPLSVQFRYLTGLKRRIFHDVRLLGQWDAAGIAARAWTEVPMTEYVGDDGCPAFTATVLLDASGVDQFFNWTVRVSTLAVADVSGIAAEVNDPDRSDRLQSFRLRAPAAFAQVETHWLTIARRLGARKVFAGNRSAAAGLRFAVWAPRAQQVEVVWGRPATGYIADDGDGIDAAQPAVPLVRGDDGVWLSAVLPRFADFEGRPYMYRLVNEQGRTVFRTDLFSRQQIGRGTTDPGGAHWAGDPAALDGTKSCSVVTGLDTVARDFAPPPGQAAVRLTDASFWAGEFTPGLPVPSRVEDLVIYELHIGALGCGRSTPGNLADAIALLPHLSDLGVNAVELLPMSEFSGIGWGYGDSHLFVIESTAGSRDQYKHFVRECHRRGIAVIQDVVYNHFDPSAARAEWAYDSDTPEHNLWYWYEGRSADYPQPDGGYLDNGSTGWLPRLWEPTVRQLFISSAAAFIEECHVDGLRVDLTQALHRDNVRHADGRSVGNANQFGAKLLREWSRTLKLIKPSVMLIAEDHTGWDKVTQLPEAGGLGFDATWYAAFYHDLIGDADAGGGHARLLREAGFGDERPLNLSGFAGALEASRLAKIVYHESHDEAGNASGSLRTLPCAVNDAVLVGPTRAWAEARTRVVVGLALLSPATPMFFMGEEVGAAQRFRYNDFLEHREDLLGLRHGAGASLFRFYQDLIRFCRRHPAVRVRAVDTIHVNPEGRVIAFRRSTGADELLVVASLANRPYDEYWIHSDAARLPDGTWREMFNSAAASYGGDGFGNYSAGLVAAGGHLRLRLPGPGFVVLLQV